MKYFSGVVKWTVRLTRKKIDNMAKKKKNTCWPGYVAKGKKKSPSGKKTKSGAIKMVNNCVKKGRKK